ncbi:MAG: ATP-grasp domain-containing protein [Chloroherpetonaceae bacterium]|nr:ATP-grasp domain-containing protein [Chloroherpetonaceae bacterium]MCS7212466.1 ATP-grasp domain-containing protein [Chloroherpetonaceae bacterium]MDW8019730.1 ATP-grasp domain-containing protein [Chloroherpetonaceae bacterium]MDW8466253.1 ATP-grasp domain-containing protein [Chloroherpetonaceae bacterium]
MKVALLYNQKPEIDSGISRYASDEYAEWDNPETIQAVAGALRRHPAVSELIMIDCHPKRIRAIVETLEQTKPDICFNIAEGIGLPSREAQIPALLDLMGIPYTGSDPATLCITLDKARTKEVLAYYGIPTPHFQVVASHQEAEQCVQHTHTYPLIVKPLHEGSSKGIFERSVVYSAKELQAQLQEVLMRYHQPALVEQFLPGREFTVGLLGNANAVEVLPIVELSFEQLPKESRRIYSYEAKWLWDDPSRPVEVFLCPAPIETDLGEEIARLCRQAFQVLRCRDWARIDVRLDSNHQPHILEVNPLPGILPNPDEHSCLPMAARQAGLSYDALIQRVLDEALKRYALAHSTR